MKIIFTFNFSVYSSQIVEGVGFSVTGRHELMFTIGLLGRWSKISGSFLGEMDGTPLDLQKLPLKRDVFDLLALLVSRFGPYWFFDSLITNFGYFLMNNNIATLS